MKVGISIFALIFVNFIFAYKYISRYSDLAMYISLAIAMSQYLLYRFFRKRASFSGRARMLVGGVLLVVILCLLVLAQLKIPLDSLHVDRWSVISSFWDEFFKGHYPYFAKSNAGNYPGPMPVYFLISLPFYLTGSFSLLSSLGYVIFAYQLMSGKANAVRNNGLLLLLLLTSLFMVWEIVTRSNIFTFTVLAVLLLDRYLKVNKPESKAGFYWLAVLSGLLLSTRSVYILPFIVFFLSDIVNRQIAFVKMLRFGFLAFSAFVVSFIPLVIVWGGKFFEMNPFIIQSSFLIPTGYAVLFICMAVAFSFFAKKGADKYFYSGLSLFVSILIYAFYHLAHSGFEATYLGSKADISYFIFSVPFFIKFLMMGESVESAEAVKLVESAELGELR